MKCILMLQWYWIGKENCGIVLLMTFKFILFGHPYTLKKGPQDSIQLLWGSHLIRPLNGKSSTDHLLVPVDINYNTQKGWQTVKGKYIKEVKTEHTHSHTHTKVISPNKNRIRLVLKEKTADDCIVSAIVSVEYELEWHRAPDIESFLY